MVPQVTISLTVCSKVVEADCEENALLTACEGIPLVIAGFPSQRVGNEERFSMSWRHLGIRSTPYAVLPQFVVIMQNLLSLGALKVLIMTTSVTTIGDKVGVITTHSFQWYPVALLSIVFVKPVKCTVRVCRTLLWLHYSDVIIKSDGISNHRCLACLLKRLFRRRSKKTSKLRVTGLCEGNPPVTGEFLSQRASDAENVSIWWRHHEPWIDFTRHPSGLPLRYWAAMRLKTKDRQFDNFVVTDGTIVMTIYSTTNDHKVVKLTTSSF